MENILLHFKLIRGVRRTLLVYLVWYYINLVHILLWYCTFLSLGNEMIARAPIYLIQCQTSRRFRTGETWGMLWANMMHSQMTMPWCTILSLSCSLIETVMVMWNAKEYTRWSSCVLISLNDFWTLVNVWGRPQMQKESCKTYTMMVRGKRRFEACMPHSKEQQTDVESLADHG